MSNKERFFEVLKDDSYGMFPAPTPAQLAVDVLSDYILGEDWYSAISSSNDQINTEIVYEILMKTSRKFRKDIKRLQRQNG